MTILANPKCPHCVQAADTLTEWCCEAGIPVAGLDVVHHPEVAQRWNVEQSPALVYTTPEGPRVHAGFPSHEEFLALAQGR